jgi:hypothetical protein
VSQANHRWLFKAFVITGVGGAIVGGFSAAATESYIGVNPMFLDITLAEVPGFLVFIWGFLYLAGEDFAHWLLEVSE